MTAPLNASDPIRDRVNLQIGHDDVANIRQDRVAHIGEFVEPVRTIADRYFDGSLCLHLHIHDGGKGARKPGDYCAVIQCLSDDGAIDALKRPVKDFNSAGYESANEWDQFSVLVGVMESGENGERAVLDVRATKRLNVVNVRDCSVSHPMGVLTPESAVSYVALQVRASRQKPVPKIGYEDWELCVVPMGTAHERRSEMVYSGADVCQEITKNDCYPWVRFVRGPQRIDGLAGPLAIATLAFHVTAHLIWANFLVWGEERFQLYEAFLCSPDLEPPGIRHALPSAVGGTGRLTLQIGGAR